MTPNAFGHIPFPGFGGAPLQFAGAGNVFNIPPVPAQTPAQYEEEQRRFAQRDREIRERARELRERRAAANKARRKARADQKVEQKREQAAAAAARVAAQAALADSERKRKNPAPINGHTPAANGAVQNGATLVHQVQPMTATAVTQPFQPNPPLAHNQPAPYNQPFYNNAAYNNQLAGPTYPHMQSLNVRFGQGQPTVIPGHSVDLVSGHHQTQGLEVNLAVNNVQLPMFQPNDVFVQARVAAQKPQTATTPHSAPSTSRTDPLDIVDLTNGPYLPMPSTSDLNTPREYLIHTTVITPTTTYYIIYIYNSLRKILCNAE